MSALKAYGSPDELHTDLILLTAWLAAAGGTPDEIVDAVAKPWKYAAEIEAARACAEIELSS